MDIYEKVLIRLLRESHSLKKLPDPEVLKPPFTLIDQEGFRHYLVGDKNSRFRTGRHDLEDSFLVQDPDGNVKYYTYKELVKKFEGE